LRKTKANTERNDVGQLSEERMQNVEQIAQFIHTHRDEDHAKLRELLIALPSADVAEVLNALASLGEAAEMLTLVPRAIALRMP
jgi:hypothetical protein